MLRATLPVVTTPNSDLAGGGHTNVGDLDLFDISGGVQHSIGLN